MNIHSKYQDSGDFVVLSNCKVGEFCIIGHPTKKEITGADITSESTDVKKFLVKDGVSIDDNGIIRSHSIIYNNTRIGKNFRGGHRILIREHTTLGDNVTVGSGAIIDGYVKIGNNSQVQSNCYIAQSVSIGNGVFIAPCVSFYDNKKIILNVKNDLDGAVVEDYARIGGGSVILPGVRIGRFSLIGSGSVVTEDVPEKSVAYGNPAKIVRKLTKEEIDEYLNSVRD